MYKKANQTSLKATGNEDRILSAATLGLTITFATIAIVLVLQWNNSEVKVYRDAVAATIQATIGACGMGNIEFHMPADAKAQIRNGCIKPLENDEEP